MRSVNGVKLPAISEAEFQRQVLQLAKLHGWRTAHFRPGLTRSGQWSTAVQGDGAGFPDLVLVRRGVLIFAELKSQSGKTSDEQEKWITQFELVRDSTKDVVRVFIWRPSDWAQIEEVLR